MISRLQATNGSTFLPSLLFPSSELPDDNYCNHLAWIPTFTAFRHALATIKSTYLDPPRPIITSGNAAERASHFSRRRALLSCRFWGRMHTRRSRSNINLSRSRQQKPKLQQQ